MRRSCDMCHLQQVCSVRKAHLTGQAEREIRSITATPDDYADIMRGIRKTLASRCRYFIDSEKGERDSYWTALGQGDPESGSSVSVRFDRMMRK